MLRSFFTQSLSDYLSFKRWLPLSSQQHKRLLSTPTAAKNNVTPFTPHGTRGPEQECTRRAWSNKEDKLLKTLYTQYGPKYTLIASHFPGRRITTIHRRCKHFFDPDYRLTHGPWKKEEIDALRTLMDEATQQTKKGIPINWETIKYRLPYPRTINSIKLTWYHTINPQWKRGRWTQDETDRFMQLVQQHGVTDWRHISTLFGTRSPRQCLEKYRHNIDVTVKGKFTPQEDAELLDAVNTHGDGDFLFIKQVLSSQRTPRQLSKRFRYALDPEYDRSEWTNTEKLEVFRLALELDGNMVEVKQRMNSKRHINDMWNHFNSIRQAKKKKTKASNRRHNKSQDVKHDEDNTQ